MTIFKEWLRLCDDSHHHTFTLSGTNLPTRVIDLGDTSSPSPNLCLRDGKDVGSDRYVALSHCWGQGLKFCTYKSNIEAFRQSIPFDKLPESFQDAVTVTRSLGVRYLWIDSLCIIQGDDTRDWEAEAGRMEQVFSGAYFTIAASSACSSADGFLRPGRQPRDSVTLGASSGVITHICQNIDDFRQHVEGSVLNKRGWVLQERALSRRSIHFTSTQVYFECGRGVHCETLTKLIK